MKTFLRVAIAMVGMTSVAVAQPKAEPKAEPKAGDAKMQPKADAKAPDMKSEPKPPAVAPVKPPAEIAEMLKGAGGTWRCKGQGMDMAAGKMAEMTATMKLSGELNGWWVKTHFESKMGKEPFVFDSYATFDPTSKKWKRLMVENSGSWATGESAGLQNGKVDWEMKFHSPMPGMTESQFKDHEDVSDPKAGVKMWGEGSSDGKNWMKVYEMTCKK